MSIRGTVLSFGRMAMIGCILVLATAGWWVLGMVTTRRSSEFSVRLGGAVESLWGRPIVQKEPAAWVESPGADEKRRLLPSKNAIKVDLDLEYRRKGLIWYSVYFCDFEGAYTFTNREQAARKVKIQFDFPSREGTYNSVSVDLDGEQLESQVSAAEGIRELIEIAPGQSRVFTVRYRRRGTREWRYRPDSSTGRILGLSATVTTDFHEIDFPDGTIPPRRKERSFFDSTY